MYRKLKGGRIFGLCCVILFLGRWKQTSVYSRWGTNERRKKYYTKVQLGELVNYLGYLKYAGLLAGDRWYRRRCSMDPEYYNSNLPGKTEPLLSQWHTGYLENQLLSKWIWRLFYCRDFIPGAINLVKAHDWRDHRH